jgi:hypothetical protein
MRPGGAVSVILISPALRAAEVRITPAPVREDDLAKGRLTRGAALFELLRAALIAATVVFAGVAFKAAFAG